MARSQVAAIRASVSRRSRPNPPSTPGVSSSGATLNETMTARDRSERAPHPGELHHDEGAERGPARVEVEIAAAQPPRSHSAPPLLRVRKYVFA